MSIEQLEGQLHVLHVAEDVDSVSRAISLTISQEQVFSIVFRISEDAQHSTAY